MIVGFVGRTKMGIGRREFLAGAGAAIASSAMARPIRSVLGGRLEYEGGEALPYDSEVEYIESTGTQWIDTGYVLDGMCSFIVKLQSTNLSKGLNNGSRVPVTPNNSYMVNLASDLNDYFFRVGTNSVRTSSVSIKYDLLPHTMYCLRNIDGSFSVSVSGVPFSGVIPKPTNLEIQPTCGLFTENRPASYGGAQLSKYGRIYYAQIFYGDTLVRDIVPVRYTNDLGMMEGAMYDRVTGGMLLNSGTGSFIIGQDIS